MVWVVHLARICRAVRAGRARNSRIYVGLYMLLGRRSSARMPRARPPLPSQSEKNDSLSPWRVIASDQDFGGAGYQLGVETD